MRMEKENSVYCIRHWLRQLQCSWSLHDEELTLKPIVHAVTTLWIWESNHNTIKPLYSKRGSWLKFFEHSNLLCVRALRSIISHAPIEEYWLRFFPQEEFNVHVDYILSKQDNTFHMSAKDTTTTGILDRIL